MRDIKFRVWSNELNEMLPSSQCTFRYKDGKIDRVDSTLFSSSGTLQNYIIEQYTGLKDKNDVEIYEGDLVKIYATNETWVGEVFFEDGAFVAHRKRWFELYTFPMEMFEVIGNVHEGEEK